MKNAIRFLERMGQDSTLRYALPDSVEAAMTTASIEPVLRHAIVSRDERVLEKLLGADGNVCCMIQVADDDEADSKHG